MRETTEAVDGMLSPGSEGLCDGWWASGGIGGGGILVSRRDGGGWGGAVVGVKEWGRAMTSNRTGLGRRTMAMGIIHSGAGLRNLPSREMGF